MTIPDHIPSQHIPRQRKERVSKKETICNILDTLRNAKMSPIQFLTAVLDETDQEYIYFRDAFYTEHKSSQRLANFLDVVWESPKGCHMLKDWMRPHAINLICEIIDEEMERAKPNLQYSTKDVTPEFISTWNINSLMDCVGSEITPVWSQILDVATENRESRMKIKTSRSRNRRTVSFHKLDVFAAELTGLFRDAMSLAHRSTIFGPWHPAKSKLDLDLWPGHPAPRVN